MTEEHTMIADSVRRFAQGVYGYGPSPHGLSHDATRLAEIGEMGLLALAVPEPPETTVDGMAMFAALAALAPALFPEPVVESGWLAGLLLRLLAPDEVRDRLLPAVVGGNSVAAVAWSHDARDLDRTAPDVSARSSSSGWVLSGSVPLVSFAEQADLLLVPAMADGEIIVLAVQRGAEGLALHPARRLDGRAVADCRFQETPAERLDGAPARPALETVADYASAAALAEISGLMDAMVAQTVDYAKTRKQFGSTLSSFQALQHRIADMWIAAEETRSLAAAAALSLAEDAEVRRETILRAAIVVDAAAKSVGAEAIQIHGGIGMTEELILGHWYRRLWALRLELGVRLRPFASGQ